MNVTKIINDIHLNTNNTFGSNDIGPSPGSPLTPSVNFSSAYAFQSIEKLDEYHNDPSTQVRYARDSNAISLQCETYLSAICEKNYGFLFNTGMSAVHAGLHILSQDVKNIVTFGIFYRKTQNLVDILCEKQQKTHINLSKIQQLDELISDNEHNRFLLVIENFSNPFLDVIDVEAIRRKYPQIKILLDFTMQGLGNSNQQKYADISVTSCTKYIGGHNDFLAGAAFTDCENLANALWGFRSSYGGIVDPFSTYLLLRSLRTYDMRLDKQLDNTTAVLKYLDSKKSLVPLIFYPFSYENCHKKYMKDGFKHGGSVITFLVCSEINVEERIPYLKSMKMAPSFGSVDTLMEIPKYMSKRGGANSSGVPQKKLDEFENLIHDPRLVRLSVGCEPINFIIDDLEIIFAQ